MDTQLQPAVDGVQDEDPTTTHYQYLEEIYIKEEPLETTSQDFEFYEFILQSIKTEECMEVEIGEDTEEEIDVVSVDEKQLTDLNCTVLPTNPSIRDRHKMQRIIASAISNKREFSVLTNGGIKTRLRLRLPNTSSNNTSVPETKKRVGGSGAGRRGVKLGRYRYSNAGGSPAIWRSSYSSYSETESNEKRTVHNDTERQRRVDLRNAFNDLRLVVPEVSGKEGAAKVMILREATSFCNRIRAESMQHQEHVAELRRQQQRLRARVSQLRRLLAAKR